VFYHNGVEVREGEYYWGKPAPTAKEPTMLRKGQFTLNDETTYEGYTTGETWNGWECPMFTKAEGLRMSEEVALDYDHEQDAFYARQLDEEADEFEDVGCYAAIETEVGPLYAIGAGEWIWDEVTEQEQA
jgi:hypothetical protein